MANTFNFIEVKYQELTTNVKQWIKDLYDKSDNNLTSASPYGQILETIVKIYENSLLYLKNVTSLFDINNPNIGTSNSGIKIIRAMARIGGYSPSLAISATGTLTLRLRSGVDISDIGNSQIVIKNGTTLTNNSNGLNYFIELGQDYATYTVSKSTDIFLPIVQGKIETVPFTGTGLPNQSLSIVLTGSSTCEQYRTVVKVNGVLWTNVSSITDMLPDENMWYSKTGIDSGLDIYFGNSNFGAIPPLGSLIEVSYVISDGSLGNIPSQLVDDFTFVDEVYDGFGMNIDVLENFSINILNEISFGADVENVNFTKAMLPNVSRNFVLVRPEHFIFTLKRLGIFSQIDAFTTEKGSKMDNGDTTDDSVVYILAVPNVSLYLTGGNSYYDLDLNAFIIDGEEKTKIENWLRVQGTMCLGTAIKILDPVISQYVMNVHIRIFDTAIEDNVRASILNETSKYFTNIERRGIIDKSAIIAIIEKIDGVDSVMVDFISKNNEEYHIAYNDYVKSILKTNPTVDITKIVLPNYEKNKVLGLDPYLGDIVYEKNEIPVIRGGFKDRNGIYYAPTPQKSGYGSVNINVVAITKRKLF